MTNQSVSCHKRRPSEEFGFRVLFTPITETLAGFLFVPSWKVKASGKGHQSVNILAASFTVHQVKLTHFFPPAQSEKGSFPLAARPREGETGMALSSISYSRICPFFVTQFQGPKGVNNYSNVIDNITNSPRVHVWVLGGFALVLCSCQD